MRQNFSPMKRPIRMPTVAIKKVAKPPEMIELAKQDAQKSPQKAAGMTMAERLARRASKNNC
jgi:hypothetical protein